MFVACERIRDLRNEPAHLSSQNQNLCVLCAVCLLCVFVFEIVYLVALCFPRHGSTYGYPYVRTGVLLARLGASWELCYNLYYKAVCSKCRVEV